MFLRYLCVAAGARGQHMSRAWSKSFTKIISKCFCQPPISTARWSPVADDRGRRLMYEPCHHPRPDVTIVIRNECAML